MQEEINKLKAQINHLKESIVVLEMVIDESIQPIEFSEQLTTAMLALEEGCFVHVTNDHYCKYCKGVQVG